MELTAEKPGMARKLDDLGQAVIGIFPRKPKPGLAQRLFEGRVELETVTMALPYFFIPINFICQKLMVNIWLTINV